MAGTESSGVILNGRCVGGEGGEWGMESFEVMKEERKGFRQVMTKEFRVSRSKSLIRLRPGWNLSRLA
jgi:hypothetical protein